jgi:leader peptidase (prepilin peptidase)/N-methyltransferase
MHIIDLLQVNPSALLTLAVVIGLLVGSFLNVLILRLPVMMERTWQSQCQSLDTEDEDATVGDEQRYDLVYPRSHCPHCSHRIAAWENIPVLSFVFLRGRCSGCRAPISARYPAIELTTAVLSGVVAWHFGVSWEMLGALVLTWSLIALTVIDYDHQLLPDVITLPILWLGLCLSLFEVFVNSHAAILGAAIGYLSLWSLYKAHKALTGKEGMGYGDFKLFALLGAWMGWESLPMVILLASVVGAVVGILFIISRGGNRDIPIPFGPYLAAAGWIALLWGDQVTTAYQRWAGMAL